MTESQKANSHAANMSTLSGAEDLINSLIVVDEADQAFINHVTLCIREHYYASRRKQLEAEIKLRQDELDRRK